MSASAAVEAALARIAERDAAVQAWEYVDAAGARAQAAANDASSPLSGFTFGVKDLYDVAGMPTTWGTPIYAHNVAVRDAAIVAKARAAGAVIVGKTVQTEFAYVAPSRTRNPWNLERTPGGSSSGSAAAVADGHVRAAFGSQTMGSVLRPASFCGVVGYKPTVATFSLHGALAVAPSFDAAGWMTRSVEDAALIRAALLDLPPLELDRPLPRFGLLRTPAWPDADAAMQTMVDDVARDYGAAEIDFGFDDADAVFMSVAMYEMRQSFCTERYTHLAQLRPETQQLLRSEQFDFRRAEAARRRLEAFDASAAFGAADVLVLPASTGEAPGLATTGNPVFNRLASAFGLPAIALPIRLGPNGLPLGLQLIARRHDDETLLAAARAIERRYTVTPSPR